MIPCKKSGRTSPIAVIKTPQTMEISPMRR